MLAFLTPSSWLPFIFGGLLTGLLSSPNWQVQIGFCVVGGKWEDGHSKKLVSPHENHEAVPMNPHESDFEYTENDGKITITGYNGEIKNLTMPAKINDLPVTSIGDWAFGNKLLTNVKFPPSLAVIGRDAFSGNKLTSIDFPRSIVSIANSAFSGNLLKSVDVPSSVSLGEYPFDYFARITRT